MAASISMSPALQTVQLASGQTGRSGTKPLIQKNSVKAEEAKKAKKAKKPEEAGKAGKAGKSEGDNNTIKIDSSNLFDALTELVSSAPLDLLEEISSDADFTQASSPEELAEMLQSQVMERLAPTKSSEDKKSLAGKIMNRAFEKSAQKKFEQLKTA